MSVYCVYFSIWSYFVLICVWLQDNSIFSVIHMHTYIHVFIYLYGWMEATCKLILNCFFVYQYYFISKALFGSSDVMQKCWHVMCNIHNAMICKFYTFAFGLLYHSQIQGWTWIWILAGKWACNIYNSNVYDISKDLPNTFSYCQASVHPNDVKHFKSVSHHHCLTGPKDSLC